MFKIKVTYGQARNTMLAIAYRLISVIGERPTEAEESLITLTEKVVYAQDGETIELTLNEQASLLALKNMHEEMV